MSALIQQTDEWLALRRTKIGASDAPVVMGVSPWATPYSLWCEKLGLSEGRPATEAMKRGIIGEEEARLCFIVQTGIPVSPKVVFHPIHEFMMASLDGINEIQHVIVEIKRPGQADHDIAISGRVPDKYYPQIQHQLDCTGYDMAYYFSYRSDDDNVLIKVNRDEKYISKMREKELEFYSCMNDFIAPKLTDRDYINRDDENWTETAQEWVSITKQLKYLEKREGELRHTLILLSQEKNSMGSGVRLARIVRKGAVDYSRVPIKEGTDLEDYRKESSISWRITTN
jgi:putative phage-type endonuclease